MKKLVSLLFLSFALSHCAVAHDGNFPTDSIENPSLNYLSANVNFGFESAYVFRGEKLANSSIQPSLNLAYEVLGFDLYSSVWANVPVKKEGSFNDLEFNSGLAYSYGMLALDVGFTYYSYDGDDLAFNRQWEIYIGASVDTASILDGINLNPSLYYIYNLTQKSHIIEAGLSYEFLIGEFIEDENLTLPVSAKLGYLSSDRRQGDQGYWLQDLSASWLYLNLTADLAYKLSDNLNFSVGIRYTQRFSQNYTNEFAAPNGSQKNVYFGAKMTLQF